MASSQHAIHCPKCNSTSFREERIVQLDSSVVIRDGLPVQARTLAESYRYICIQCNEILTHN
ncbi:hypothetical protein [Alicyclobacillus acidoterrestris]|uniref:Uncharacterized protein n=1 Tax=Alicyclobacillus acidoterrestris (strain ATCC 49025 / DSM 3922 / CIP 106132 / NCIMB 13137 / GD3B) TaxID=1356854 RepID=T0DHP6_ALIAG|nr:hypothetical protein [Alicyclobacillus acidoterrestris]EPZ49046.1 hypothetical protein N007_04190 [Alicyclobacillus acidoterrestris ATCC 49025]UNO47567.1 hypothetical protein K1I37_12750 [Alicyclobacillus acidoterrestris]GEO25879.1 hypothetical protein AAC03nite_16640 [Alicyclobacillus acidoterrestris]